ncbi:oxidoreductase [Paenibacillus sp. Soil766]|uniref:Gfo/Idh/MocA family protein n=1 Tax=Paenibacillus sp. Soil766 TaxID=1736404 RepID=UPI00070B5DF7|nr:Gfo/Idh/MocA family oxidoreductase [Paenibacillus sp. Soil766]KRF02300.1 oxidoreductase [Paenibacillus sp. Soil766]
MTSYKIAVIGCGGMANAWIDYAQKQQNCTIVALVDINLDYAQAMADKHELKCGVYTDMTQAITESGANLVFDVTIPASHHQVSTTALQLGCNVFGEKPMAATMQEARDIIRVAEQTGKSFSVMQNRRYNTNIRAFRNMITKGSIGKTGFISADFFIGAHFGGFRDAMDSPLILDMAIHTFDQARYLSGANPISVYCHEFNPAGSWYAGNSSAICIFEFSDGSVFNYRGSWSAEGASTSWEAAWRVIGEQGTIIWDGTTAPYAEVVSPGDQTGKFIRDYTAIQAECSWSGNEGHSGCLDEMFSALRESRPAETDGHDNIQSIAMVLGALESAKSGRKIDLREFI